MRYGIPLMGNRVAPRCTYADSVLLVVLKRNRVSTEDNISFADHSLFNLIELLSDHRVDTLICCGISRESKEFLVARNVNIIDNVSCTIDEIIEALKKGALRSGFGLSESPENKNAKFKDDRNISYNEDNRIESGPSDSFNNNIRVDCISCLDRVCLRGGECSMSSNISINPSSEEKEIKHMLEATLDIACEEERKLCRLSELIYFCLEMKYKRIGIAYCTDLQEPAEILTQVLRRFFDVFPVCCKIGGVSVDDPFSFKNADSDRGERRKYIACNPRGQAEALNKLGTDLNVIVGICIGADSIFTHASDAPVTTLFVKDKSLANNPIGALYSDYYLNEASMAEVS